MKKKLLCVLLLSAFMLPVPAQVTRLSNNTSYDWGFALTNTKIMLRSAITKTIWVYDIPGNSFTQLSSAVTVEQDYDFGVMNGKLYFAGKTVAEGIELWVSDGTPGGTTLVKDINTTGAADSEPKYGFVVYNNEIYFTANDGTTGRELWKSDGTPSGTVQVKDINTGAPDAFSTTTAPVFNVINNTLVFTAITATDGNELWKSDGTGPGTTELKNIYTTPSTEGSRISSFTVYGTDLIFTALDEVSDALWKTDGTVGGTSLVKRINPTPLFPPPFLFPSIFPPFFNFQNELYFAANDGTSGIELWKTDGTDPGTMLVKDIDPGPDDGFPLVAIAVTKGNKFFFSAATATDGRELWESDGTGPGTQLLKDIAVGATSSDVITIPNYLGNGLFQGDKFFLVATTPAEGAEYYISDGTAVGTTLLKDIGPGTADGFNIDSAAFFYTTTKFFFVGDNVTNGPELWQSDGTTLGTTMVADINTLPVTDGSNIRFATLASNTIFFFGTDGDDAAHTDFFRIDGSFTALPLRWVFVEARPYNNDILLSWETAAEEQTDYFIIQRSADGMIYRDIGRVNANGGITNSYSFTDAGAMQQAGIKKWFYRIKYVDKDGKSATSKIVTVALDRIITQMRIMPNPVVHELKLVIYAAGNDHAVVTCINMEGKIVMQRSIDIHTGENTVTNDVSRLANGVYLLQVIIGGSITKELFLIQH